MKKTTFLIVVISLSVLYMMGACTKDKLSEPEPSSPCDSVNVAYNPHTKAILDANCSYAGCHDGATTPPDLTAFSAMSAFDKERIIVRAVEQQTMPPTGALSSGLVDTLRCWHDNGFPEN